ncbi:MAG: MCE family protein [Actinomycetota bacterium]|nr:MCE family protein [Actinomycetota bacterium]
MRTRLLSLFITIAVVGAAVGAYIAFRPNEPTYTVTAEVAQAPNLFAGGRVMVRGVEVGKITKVTPSPTGVRLTMAIDEDVRVPADARLSVVPITVIADRYVQLYPAYKGGPALADGDDIPMSRTAIPAELDEVVAQLKRLLVALEPKNGEQRGPLAKLIDNLDAATRGEGRELGGTLGHSASVLQNLANSHADLTALIRNLNSVFGTLANRSTELALVNQRLAVVTKVLASDRRDLQGTISNIGLLSSQASRLVSESGANLGRAFERLKVVLDNILARQDELTAGIGWTNVITEALGATGSSGKGLFAYTGRQAPPGTAGAKYNYRLDTRDTITCQRLNAVAQTTFVVTPQATLQDLVFTILSYIPDTYDDDLEFLVRETLRRCVDFPGEAPVQTQDALYRQATRVVHEVAAEVGRKKFERLLLTWLATSPGQLESNR